MYFRRQRTETEMGQKISTKDIFIHRNNRNLISQHIWNRRIGNLFILKWKPIEEKTPKSIIKNRCQFHQDRNIMFLSFSFLSLYLSPINFIYRNSRGFCCFHISCPSAVPFRHYPPTDDLFPTKCFWSWFVGVQPPPPPIPTLQPDT